MAFIATCLAITIGALWEVFEYGMDTWFGTNMLKSGLDDVMSDMMVNTVGAVIGGGSGWLYLRGERNLVFTRLIDQFVEMNRRIYRRSRDRIRRRREK